jgi:versiconal hemiacetal acetate esterase
MLDDVVTAWKWAWENAERLGGDRRKYVSFGGSAGGSLALGLTDTLVASEETRSQVKGCVALVPPTLSPENVPADVKDKYNSFEVEGYPLIDAKLMRTIAAAIEVKPDDSRLWTALSGHLDKWPKTYIVVCGCDPLHDEGVIMEGRLREAGYVDHDSGIGVGVGIIWLTSWCDRVKTKLDDYPGLPHYFWIFPQLETARVFMENLLKGIHFVLS